MSQPTLWVNGELVDRQQARVDLLAHGLHYGTGVFEGIRCYDTGDGPGIFRLDEHMDRFERGAKVLGMDLDISALKRGILEAVTASGFASAYIRPIAYYAVGGLALDTAPLTPHVAVAVMPWTSHLGDTADHGGIRAFVSSYRRTSAKALPPLKLCGAYANSILAKREAALAGYDEAFFVDDDGFVCEATGENIFMVQDGQVIAVAHRDALAGITRATVIERTGAVSRAVHLDELLDADEDFVTGTSAEVVPVREINGRVFETAHRTRAIQSAYSKAVRGLEFETQRWVTRL